MLRFVIRRKLMDAMNGLQVEQFETVDAECPALEAVLCGGGVGYGDQHGYDYREVAGVELLPDQPGAAERAARKGA